MSKTNKLGWWSFGLAAVSISLALNLSLSREDAPAAVDRTESTDSQRAVTEPPAVGQAEPERVSRIASIGNDRATEPSVEQFVTGSVFGVHGDPLPGAYVDLDREAFDPPSAARVATDATGRFRLPTSGGAAEHFFVVSAEGFAPARVYVPADWLGIDFEARPIQLEAEAVVRGRVVDETGSPIAAIQLYVDADDVPWVRSDASGAFVLRGLPAGQHVVNCIAGEGRVQRLESNRIVRVGTGGSHDLGAIVLESTVRIRGRLIDDTGDPVASGRVFAYVQRSLVGRYGVASFSQLCGDATSDAHGAFEIAVPRSGGCELSAMADGYLGEGLAIESTTTNPTLTLYRQSKLVIGARDAVTGAPLPIDRVRVGVIDEHEVRSPRFRTYFDSDDASFDEATGLTTFHWIPFDRQPGQDIFVVVGRAGYEIEFARLRSSSAGAGTPIVMELVPGGFVTVRCVDAATSLPLANDIEFELLREEPMAPLVAGEWTEFAGKSLRVDSLGPGEYRIWPIAPGSFDLAASARDLESKTVTLRHVRATAAPTVELRFNRTATVHGRIRGMRCTIPLRVIARHESGVFANTNSDGAGVFTLRGLIAGMWRLGLGGSDSYRQTEDSVLFAAVECDPPAIVNIAAGAEHEVELDVSQSKLGRIVGAVLFPAPLGDEFEIRPESESLSLTTSDLSLAADGSFESDWLTPASYELAVIRRLTRDVVARRTVELAPRAVARCTFEAFAPGTVRGKVIDTVSRSPVCDGDVTLTLEPVTETDEFDTLEFERRLPPDGSFEFDFVPPGAWTLRMDPGGVASQLPIERSLVLRGGEVVDLALDAQPAGAATLEFEPSTTGGALLADDEITIEAATLAGESTIHRAQRSSPGRYLLSRLPCGVLVLRSRLRNSPDQFRSEATIYPHVTTTVQMRLEK